MSGHLALSHARLRLPLCLPASFSTPPTVRERETDIFFLHATVVASRPHHRREILLPSAKMFSRSIISLNGVNLRGRVPTVFMMDVCYG